MKCRIGIVNEYESYDDLKSFVDKVSTAGGVEHFVVHARSAILDEGVTTKGNRSIPPLQYDRVHSLVRDFPELKFTLNGGVSSLSQAKELLTSGVYGIMVGRAIARDPWAWRDADEVVYGEQRSGASVSK